MKISAEVQCFLSTIGAKGGSSRSAAKIEAVRNNGKLGGRPRKVIPTLEAIGFSPVNQVQDSMTVHQLNKKKRSK